jgi:predicted dehydrogenase
VHDNGVAVLKFKQGAIASIACSFSYPYFENELTVIGTKKSARVVRGNVYVEENRDDQSSGRSIVGALREGLHLSIRSMFSSPLKSELAYFLACIQNATPPECDIAFDLNTLGACLAIVKQGKQLESKR